jgi:hypothetical protein
MNVFETINTVTNVNSHGIPMVKIFHPSDIILTKTFPYLSIFN